MTQNEHNFIHENIAAYLAGGLSAEERARFDAHIHGCAECFDAFTEARDADRTLLRLGAAPDADFENNLVSAVKGQLMPRRLVHPMVKRAGVGVAAALLLGATGLAANHLVENDLLSNPMSAQLMANARPQLPGLSEFLPHFDFSGNVMRRTASGEDVLRESVSLGSSDQRRGRTNWSLTPADSSLPLEEDVRGGRQRAGKDLAPGEPGGWADQGQNKTGKEAGRPQFTADGKSSHDDFDAEGMKKSGIGNGKSTGNERYALRGEGNFDKEKVPPYGIPKVTAAPRTSAVAGDGYMRRAIGELSNENITKQGSATLSIPGGRTYYQPGIGGALAYNDGAKNAPQAEKYDEVEKKLGEVTKHQLDRPAVTKEKIVAKTEPLAAATPAPTGSAGSAPPPPPVVQAEVAQRKIIRNGEVEFEVRAFDDAYQTVATVVGEEGGFVSSTSSDKLANGKIRGTIVVRVPPERLDRLLLKLRALGKLKSQQISANDVTKQYTDLESELRALRAMEERLINLIKGGKGEVKDIIEAEKQLGTYRVRIEKIEGEIRYYNNLVGMATLTITAYEKDIQKPTAAAEQENITLALETDDVETKYKDARKAIDDAKGRIVESELKKLDADQFTARIVCEVAPDKADIVAAQLRQLGKLARFDRDRKQTTTGGTGAPTVQVQQKETRFIISMYNLANVAPRETTTLTLAVRDVDAAYKAVLGQVRATVAEPEKKDDKPLKGVGRVISSSIVGERAEQMVADVRADLVTAHADGIISAIRQAGEVLTTSTAENPDTANVTTAKRGLQLRIVSSAAVMPKETTTINLAVRDVDVAFKSILAKLRAANAEADKSSSKMIGRVISSALSGEQPEKMTGDLRADMLAGDADALIGAIRQAGEVLTIGTVESGDSSNVTASKRGLQLRIISAAAIAPRENHTMTAIAPEVAKAYGSLLEIVQKPGDLKDPLVIPRILSSQLVESDPQNVRGTIDIELPREAQLAFEKRMTDAGIDIASRNTVRSTDTANTLENKLRYQITLTAAQLIAPKRTSIVGVEVESVDKAVDSLRAAIGSNNVREIDFNMNKEANGRTSARFVLDVPVRNTMNMLTAIRDLRGEEKVHQTIKNANAPDSRYSVERIELTLASRDQIISNDKGFGSTIRAALGASAAALLYSLYLVVTGVLFIGPWVLILWIVWRLFKRRKTAAQT